MSGMIVMIKSGFEYPQLRSLNVRLSNLGTPRTENWPLIFNFPNSQLYQKLNRWKCKPIKNLNIIDQFSVLGVPRMLQYFVCPFQIFLCTSCVIY